MRWFKDTAYELIGDKNTKVKISDLLKDDGLQLVKLKDVCKIYRTMNGAIKKLKELQSITRGYIEWPVLKNESKFIRKGTDKAQAQTNYNKAKKLIVEKVKTSTAIEIEFRATKNSVQTQDKGTRAQVCSGCGIVVKHIPSFYMFSKSSMGSTTHICPFCIMELTDKAATMLNSKGEEWIKDVKRQRFIHNLQKM